MSKSGVSYKGDLPAQQALALLENLVESLKKGSVCVQVDQEHVVMGLSKSTPVGVEIGASQKKGKRRLSLELSWSDPKHDAEQASAIMIGTQAPTEAAPKTTPAAAPVEKPAVPKKAAPKKAVPKKKAAAPKKASKKATTRKKATSPKNK
ncbi:MAG: amphi-Trp domain-containing protein [Deltaproteobacteria bacterium]|nr:amphi-Trp domain-containing protein [Deltaproteobacteria bacterium]